MAIANIQIESSTICNLDCIFCPRTKRTHGMMSDDLFRKIVREGKEMGVKTFIPFLNGEPFAFPRIFDWLDYLEKEKAEVHLYTNASLLNEEKIDKLATHKSIRYIYCSLSGATEETYQKVTKGKNFNGTKANIEHLIKVMPCTVRVGMVVIQETYPEKELFKQTWGRRAKFSFFKNWGGSVHDSVEVTGPRLPCRNARKKITVLWDGRVCLCCFDHNGEVILGDVNKQSLKEIWHNSAWVREKHDRLDYSNLPICQNCNFNVSVTEHPAL